MICRPAQGCTARKWPRQDSNPGFKPLLGSSLCCNLLFHIPWPFERGDPFEGVSQKGPQERELGVEGMTAEERVCEKLMD